MGMWEQYDKSLRELIDLAKATVRKQVCDEIREELDKVIEVGDYYDTENDTETGLVKITDIEKILDQIEKGYKEL